MAILLPSGTQLIASLSSGYTPPSSVMFWIRRTAFGDYWTFSQGSYPPSVMRLQMSGPTLYFGAGDGGVTGISGGADLLQSGGMRCVLLVVRGAMDMTFYSPGGVYAYSSYPYSGVSSADYLTFFGDPGHYAEIAKWNSALTTSDYTTLASGAAPETVSPETIADVWTLNPEGIAGSAAPTAYTSLLTSNVLNSSGALVVSDYGHPVTRAAATPYFQDLRQRHFASHLAQ